MSQRQYWKAIYSKETLGSELVITESQLRETTENEQRNAINDIKDNMNRQIHNNKKKIIKNNSVHMIS